MTSNVHTSPTFIRRTRSLVMSLQTIKEGHLYKRGKLNTEWRQRLFILNGKQLAYFKGGVSAEGGREGEREGGRKRKREGEKEGGSKLHVSDLVCPPMCVFLVLFLTL